MSVLVKDNKHIFSGFINDDYFAVCEVIRLSDEKDLPHRDDEAIEITEYAEDNFAGKQVNVSYYVSDEKISLEDVQREYIMSVMGLCNAEVFHHYSDVTGYLWSDEEFVVGGHDMINELRSHEGKYLNMIVEVLN